MKKKPVTTSFLLFLLLLVLVTPMQAAGERLQVLRVKPDSNGVSPFESWIETSSPYNYRFSSNLALKLYTGFDQKYLYLGFEVKDSFLTFTDDFSLDFQGSDHLRVNFFPEGVQESPVTLYLLPSSKIKEPLFNIQGASWRRTSVTLRSFPVPKGYFLAVTIDLANLGLSPWQREIPLQIMVNDVNKKGQAKTHWLFGAGSTDYGTLVLSL